MASVAKTAATITVRFRTAPNVGASTVSLADADATVLAAARGASSDGAAGRNTIQVAIGRRPRGDMSSTSRVCNLPRLLFSDFDRSVHRIGAQPFSIC